MSESKRIVLLGEATAHGCAFCAGRMGFDEPDQLPLVIPNGGREHRFWVHRACFRERVQPHLQAAVDRIPPARREDLFPKRLPKEDREPDE